MQFGFYLPANSLLVVPRSAEQLNENNVEDGSCIFTRVDLSSKAYVAEVFMQDLTRSGIRGRIAFDWRGLSKVPGLRLWRVLDPFDRALLATSSLDARLYNVRAWSKRWARQRHNRVVIFPRASLRDRNRAYSRL